MVHSQQFKQLATYSLISLTPAFVTCSTNAGCHVICSDGDHNAVECVCEGCSVTHLQEAV